MSILTVGIAKQFATITAAVNAAASGDTIDVEADHVYTNDFPIIKKSLVLQAVDGEVKMRETHDPGNGKAMIVAGNPGLTIAINGFDIAGVSVPDQNGAAIRYEGGNLSLTNDYFHNNQEGLLGAADAAGNITVTHSEFAFNGDGSGLTHNIYVGRINSFTATDSYFHDAVEGHEIKSRAATTVIENNRIFDNNGTASYSVDTPNGGGVTIKNNIIEQGPHSDNNFIIAYGEEGSLRGGTAVSIEDNTIVNDEAGGKLILNRTTDILGFTNNQIWNIPQNLWSPKGSIDAKDNVILASRPTLDTSSLTFINPGSGGPPPPPPTLAQYHADVLKDFQTWATSHPVLAKVPEVLGVLASELHSTTVLPTPPPGDLWS
jgi:hypothetical protein